MDNLTPRQQKRLERLAKSLQDKDISAIEHLSDIEEKVEDLGALVASEVSSVREELKKKFDSESVLEIDPEAIRGPKGDRGDDGADADEEEIIDRVLAVSLAKIPTPQEVAAFVPNLKGDPGEPGAPGRDGADGTPGRDGSPDSPLDIAGKLNTTTESVEPTVIKGLAEIGRLARIGASNAAVPSVSHTALEQVATRVAALEASPGGDTSGLVPYTGATGDVNLGTHTLIAHAVKGDASDGLLLEASNGTDIGILGPANTANVSWYGAHTYSQMAEGSVAFFGANGLLSQDNQNFYFHGASKQLDVYGSLGSEKVTNGGFGSATGWTVPSGWSVSGGKATHGSNGTGALSQTGLAVAGEEYTVSATFGSFTAGSVTVTFGGQTLGTVSSAGTQTWRVVATSTGALVFTPTNTARFDVDDVSVKLLSGGSIRTGQFSAFGSHSNSSPGTTYMQRFDNSGSNTWTEYRFAGTLRAALGANSSGGMGAYFSGGNGFAWYLGDSGLTSNGLVAFLFGSGFTHYGYGYFGGSVHAGAASTPSSTLQTAGSFAAKVDRKTANFTADAGVTTYIVDASSASCSGTPTYACAHWTNQTDCEKWDAHGGCTWFAGSPCSAYNGDQSSCQGHSGCTYESASCSGAGDQSSCEAQDDNYGGSCAWTNNPQSCSGFDESTCNSTSGCTANPDDCANYSDGGGDGTACNAANGGSYCSYDSGSGACSGGTFGFLSCSGTYDSYSCTGSYYTGNCTGTYGASCSGTSSCSGIDDSTNCGNEGGCTWATTVTAGLPSVLTCPGRQYWFYNASSTGADLILQPYSGDTVDHTTSLTLGTYKDWVHVTAFADLRSCAGLDEATCGSTSGCTQDYANCAWNSGSSTCSGHASCTGYGDQSSCAAATYYEGCSGTYYASKNWYVVGR